MKKAKVLIVGAGPVGLVTVNCLKKYNVDCEIIEKRTESSTHSKALSINAATLKIFEHMGIIDKFLKKGKKCKDIYVHWNNSRIMHIDYGRLPSRFPYFLALPQPETEKILTEDLLKRGVNVQRGIELLDIENIENEVKVTLKTYDNKIIEKYYDYVVACDGGKSVVRHKLGLSFEGHNYNMMFKMIDCNVEWDGDKSATHYFVKENGFLILIPLSNNMHRIVLKTEKEEEFLNAEKLSTDEFQKLVNKYGGSNIKISNIIWKTEAPFYNRLIEKYREVRVFFAGDSSHLFSPIGGLGMNTGIQDAYNISWKLAGVIHKKYSEDILDTYESERRSIAKILIAGTDNTTKLIARIDKDTSSGIQNWLPVMSNRILMKVEYPLRFSGLGQCYTDMNGTIIRSIPYVSVIFKEKKEINSYHLVKGYIPIPLVFSRNKELRKIGKQNFIIVSDCEHENANDDFFIFDPDRKYYNAFNAKEGDVYLLRPDGYMKFLGQFNNDLELSNIFKVNFKEIFYDAA